MKQHVTIPSNLFAILLVLLGMVVLVAACQTSENVPSPAPPAGQTVPPGEQTPETDQPAPAPADPELINTQWFTSAHAGSFVTDPKGANNSCAQCHAPVQWQPTLADLPESCFTCKFELSEPPPYIAETDWQSIPCKVCHEADKKGNPQPAISWLEIAALDEYTPVQNSSELCLKCHGLVKAREHAAVEVGGAHADMLCSDCHNAHDLTASCGQSGCHKSLEDPGKVVPGHDEDHSQVACAACHDGSGMQVGPLETTGTWTTFAPWTIELEAATESGEIPFTSHNTVLDVVCERCHFQDNPWGLSVDITTP